MSFINGFKEMTQITETENGATAFTTTGSELLNFFALIGGMRDRDEQDIIELYQTARKEDKEMADKVVLYSRDVRGPGLGERKIGRILLRGLAILDPAKVKRNFQTFVDNGRFDDLYCLVGTPVELDMWKFMKKTFLQDLDAMAKGMPISLASKWMKSINTSSKESRKLAKKFCNFCGITEKTYRKSLAKLRNYSNVVEAKMSRKKWNEINFNNVPSVAMNRYTLAFQRNCTERFEEYKRGLTTGETKINANTLFPYDVIKPIMFRQAIDEEIMEAQWKALPNYFKEGKNVICCADVSGSMSGMPMAVSISLALYCARFNTGAYHGSYLTFTDKPYFYEFDENRSLRYNVEKVMEHEGYNTNLDGMLEAIYEIAVKAQDTPEALLIVSDDEIDYFTSCFDYQDIVSKWVNKYHRAGLECPKIIFWNCSARNNHYLVKKTNPYVSFVSGCSSGTFANLAELIDNSAYDAMIKILNQYEFI